MIQSVADAAPPTWLSGWVGVVVGVIGVLGILASAAAYLRASYAKATVATLAESNAALTEQVRILKEERETEREEWAQQRREDAARTASMAVKVEHLERENTRLTEIVQGKADVERLVMLIQDHHHEVIEDRKGFHREWRGEIDKVQATLDDVLTAQGEQVQGLRQVRAMTGRMLSATVGERT